jgi:hypothetical protein
MRSSAAASNAGQNLPRGKRRARNPGRQALPAVPENQRRHDRPVRRTGTDPRPHGPHPGRTRPRPPRGGLENRRGAAPAGCRRLEELFDQLLVLRNEIALAAGFPDFRAYTFAPLRALRLYARGLPPLSRRHRAPRRPARARVAGGTSAPEARRGSAAPVGPRRRSRPPRRSIPSPNRPSCSKNATRFSPSSTRASATTTPSCASSNWSISTTARARRPAATRAPSPRRASPSSS